MMNLHRVILRGKSIKGKCKSKCISRQANMGKHKSLRKSMKITVHYKSGLSQIFIVPAEIQVTEFRKIAEKAGGEVHKIDFSSCHLKSDKCYMEGKF